MARFGRNEQLVIAGSAVALVAYLIGVLTQDWSISLSALSIMIGSLVALAIVLTGVGRSVAGYPGGTLLRIAAALVGAFAFVDLGDLIASLSQWETLTIALKVVYIAAAAVIAHAAWAASGGNLVSDLSGVGSVMRMTMIDRLVYLGGLGVIVSWFLMMAIADIFTFKVGPQISVLAATLVLVVRWLDRSPAAGRLPIAAAWAIAVLAGVAVIAGVIWLLQAITDDRTFEFGGITAFVPMLVYLVALASLGVGAFLGIGVKASQPAA